jgi:CRP/FNR family transcriptional regulator
MDTPFVPSTIEIPNARQPGGAQPLELDMEELQRHMVVTRRKIRAGQYLYRSGQPFHALYLVHAGFLKTCELSEDGREQVTGFRMRGDLLGVESIGLAVHASDAIALEDSHIWELPYPPVLSACLHIPELQVRLSAALAATARGCWPSGHCLPNSVSPHSCWISPRASHASGSAPVTSFCAWGARTSRVSWH